MTMMELMASYATTASMTVPRQATIPNGITASSMPMAAATKPFIELLSATAAGALATPGGGQP